MKKVLLPLLVVASLVSAEGAEDAKAADAGAVAAPRASMDEKRPVDAPPAATVPDATKEGDQKAAPTATNSDGNSKKGCTIL